MTTEAQLDVLAERLAEAWRTGNLLEKDYPVPALPDEAASYTVQRKIFALNKFEVGGWKIGAKSPNDPANGAPLPRAGLQPSGAQFAKKDFSPCGLELEIAFRFGRVFEANGGPYSDEEVIGAIESMAATIEVVASRYVDRQAVGKLATLADVGSHGALVFGKFSPYQGDFPYLAPALRLTLNGVDISTAATKGVVGNPAGDPRRLLPWFVNHATSVMGLPVTPNMIVTTGTYTGMFEAPHAGEVRGEIAGLAPVALTLV